MIGRRAQLDPRLASIGTRFVARFIDALVLLPAYGLLFLFRAGNRVTVVGQLVGFAISTVYEVALIALRGQTVGKIAMRIRVVAVGDDSSAPGWERAIARSALPAGASLLQILGPEQFAVVLGLVTFVIYLWAAFDSNRQGLHDKVAQTLVVRAA